MRSLQHNSGYPSTDTLAFLSHPNTLRGYLHICETETVAGGGYPMKTASVALPLEPAHVAPPHRTEVTLATPQGRRSERAADLCHNCTHLGGQCDRGPASPQRLSCCATALLSASREWGTDRLRCRVALGNKRNCHNYPQNREQSLCWGHRVLQEAFPD